jgi:hypothetical protein
MAATRPSKKSASRKATHSRTAGKKGPGKKKAGKKQASPGLFSRASHMVGEVLMGAATGAVTGAVKGAIEAGGKEAGIPRENEGEQSSPKSNRRGTKRKETK